MVFREYGCEHPDTVMLLHGGGLSWWNFREEAQLLQSDYHVVLPVLDGHSGSDRPFTSIEDNASELIAYIDGHFGGKLLFIGGLSLGGQVLLEMLAQRGDICSFALVESTAVIPSRLTSALIGPAFGSSYGLIRSRAFSRLQFRSLHMKPELFEDYYRDTCGIRKEDMLAFMKASTSYALKDSAVLSPAQVRIVFGEKERGTVLRSANMLHRHFAGSGMTVCHDLYHGEFSLNRPQEYVRLVREIIGR